MTGLKDWGIKKELLIVREMMNSGGNLSINTA
jgi:hypothetical protein